MNNVDESAESLEKRNILSIMNTNARSLCPKMNSLIECFEELSVDIAVVTETWLKAGPDLDQMVSDLSLGSGIGSVVLNRDANPTTGVAYGGVAVFYKKKIGNLKPINYPNPEKYEVLGTSRKIVIIAAYLPPNYTVPRGTACMEYVEDLIVEVKRRFSDPYIVLAGDFNQWRVEESLVEFADISEVPVGPTRGDREIDRIFCNMGRSVATSGTVPPLDSGPQNTHSDYRIAYSTFRLQRQQTFEWITYSYRLCTDESRRDFGSWIMTQDWAEVLQAAGPNEKARAYQDHIDAAMDAFFPVRTTRRKSTDPPWLNKAILKKIARRNRIYLKEGKSPLWHYMKKEIEKTIKERKGNFMQLKKEQLTAKDASRSFFRLVKAFNTPEKPQSFDVRSLCPGMTDDQVAEELAVFFNRISAEFDPLSEVDTPAAPDRQIPPLSVHEVAGRVRRFRKPKSMVSGDVFPALLTTYADFFAVLLTSIYNDIIRTNEWPDDWKTEYVTVIPKNSSPQTFADLRNISCTRLISKIMESYVLEWAGQEVACKYNQYGGVKGCSGTHMLINVWQKILTNLEDRRAGVVLTSIDYAKAFNRLSFQHCLRAFAKRGASSPILRLIASFLTNRTMTVKVSRSWSVPRPVTGGCPQGSILGVLLFNLTVDDLEDGSDFVEFVDRPAVGLPDEEEEDYDTARPDNRAWCDSPVSPALNLGDDPTGGLDEMYGETDKVASTPVTGGVSLLFTPSPIPDHAPWLQLDESDVLPERGIARVVYSSEEDITPPPEPTKTCLGEWHQRKVAVNKYVDDNLQEEGINFENAEQIGNRKFKHAVASQNVFRMIVRNAERKGMKVNTSKTGMLCVSDSLNTENHAYLYDRDGEKIESGNSLKVLGWHFSPKPTVGAHIDALKRRFRERYWTLRHLKHNGFTKEDLVKVYVAVIRPVAEYMLEVFHSMLTDAQDESIERLQVHALKCIFGPGISGRRMRERAGLETLRTRRIERCDRFAKKCAEDPRFEHWFPENMSGRSTRNREKYKEEYARCNRLYNSPIFYMRRRLNGKEGKSYGVRNKEFREG